MPVGVFLQRSPRITWLVVAVVFLSVLAGTPSADGDNPFEDQLRLGMTWVYDVVTGPPGRNGTVVWYRVGELNTSGYSSSPDAGSEYPSHIVVQIVSLIEEDKTDYRLSVRDEKGREVVTVPRFGTSSAAAVQFIDGLVTGENAGPEIATLSLLKTSHDALVGNWVAVIAAVPSETLHEKTWVYGETGPRGRDTFAFDVFSLPGTDTADVPAGTFEHCHVTETVFFWFGETNTERSWFARGAGLVKWQCCDGDGGMVVELRLREYGMRPLPKNHTQ